MSYRPKPPPAAQKLIERIGYDFALKLIEARAGAHFYITSGGTGAAERARQQMDAEFGAPMAEAIIGAFGGDYLEVPLCREWRAEIYHLDGVNTNEIARRLGVTRATVSRYLNKNPATNGQIALPL